ncbi:hypothetical protein HJFPF1_03620 [Paramyrothecium foliicola]|nr:hypothetical protein HJFPF1_03620 [Paramyrothecium foliicola]
MVQNWSRDAYARHPFYQVERLPADATSRHHGLQHDRYTTDLLNRSHTQTQERGSFEGNDNGRFAENHDLRRRQPPMQIDEALRSHCGIAAKQYFVAAIMEDGSPITFFSPGQRLHDAALRQFFDSKRFQQVVERIEMGADPRLEDSFSFEDTPSRNPTGLGRRPTIESRRNSRADDPDGHVRTGRKRPRARHLLHDDEDAPMVVSSRRGIKIGDSQAVWSFYEQRFKNCQQTACKSIAKAWVKAVEPKKQTNHPYTGSDQKAPEWWPKPWGPTKEDKVRHKEPDHLYKRERVHLLVHILRLVLEPHAKQHSEIQKVHLSVKKLEEITFDALSAFFMDNEANSKKKPYLNEIFKVARQEERFRNGEIDGTTEVYVMAEDKIPESYASDNDDGSFVKEEDDQEITRGRSAALATPTSEQSPVSSLHTGPFINDLPMRPQFSHPIMPDMSTQHAHFVEGTGIPVQTQPPVNSGNGGLPLDMVQSPHDTSRRPSIFSDYASPGASNIYPQQWQPGSTTANTSPLYAYTTAQASTQQPSFVNSAVPMGHGQAFMATNFEGSPRPSYDPTANAMFRANELGQASVSHTEGYNYLPHDNRGLRVVPQGVDPASRNHLS